MLFWGILLLGLLIWAAYMLDGIEEEERADPDPE